MKKINSADNKILKQAASLSEKKHRDALGLYLIEGPNFIKDAINYGGRLRFIFIRAGNASLEIEEILSLSEDKGPAVITLSDIAFEKICSTKTSQGIVAVAEQRRWKEEEFFKGENSNILVLDRIQDPGNMGTMIRTAEALGFGGVLLLKGCADPYGSKLVRAAAGSLFRLPLFNAEDPKSAITLLKKYGKNLFSAVMTGGEPCFKAKIAQNAAIIIGNEGNGICEELLKASNLLSIPMTGDIESLNAALAAGILMYEAYRQKRSNL